MAKKKEIRGSSGDRGEQRSSLERGTQSRGTLLQILQGIYYYFYQAFKNRAEAITASRKRKGKGDGTVGMFSWFLVAAIAGCFTALCTSPIWVLVTRMQVINIVAMGIMENFMLSFRHRLKQKEKSWRGRDKQY